MLLDPITSQFEHKSDLKIQDKTFFRTPKLSIPPSNLYQEMELDVVVVVVFFSLSSSSSLFFLRDIYCESREKRPGSSRRARNRRPSSILTHSRSSSQRSWPWMTAVAVADGQGEEKKTLSPLPSH